MTTSEEAAKSSKPAETTCYAVNQGDKVEVNIKFRVDDEKMAHIRDATESLRKAGVSFDTGGCRGEDGKIHYDWEFDWSLKGGEVFFRRTQKEA